MLQGTCGLLIGLWTSSAFALLPPQQSHYTNVSSTNAIITSSAFLPTASQCVLDCRYDLPPMVVNVWIPAKITSITVATLIVIVDHHANKTSTSTKYAASVNGSVPTNAGGTNAAGTSTQVVTYMNGSTTTVAYPTPFLDYSTTYHWSGVLPITNGQDTKCLTATTGPYVFPSHPPLPTTIAVTPTGDQYGLEHALFTAEFARMPQDFAVTAFPHHTASLIWAKCILNSAGVVAMPQWFATKASYLTETSTTHITNAISSTLPPAPPPELTLLSTSTSSHPSAMPDVLGSSSTPPIESSTINSAQVAPSPTPVVKSPSSAPSESSTTLAAITPSPSFGASNSPHAQTVVDDSTVPLYSTPVPIPAAVIGGTTYTPNSASVYIIGSQTLTPGGGITVSGTPLSLPLSASYVVEGTSTIPLSFPTTTLAPLPIAVIGGTTYTPNSASAYIIGSQTLILGGEITVSGTPLSLPLSASYVVEGTSTIPLSLPTTTLPHRLLTLEGQTYTMDSASDFIIGSQTLAPGAVITVSGTPVSLAATPTDAVVGTSTEGLGVLIISGLGGGVPSSTPFKGGAAGSRPILGYHGYCMAGMTLGILCALI
ncbi:hypothetical protein MMC13_003829 [Lambiella insularis]|nr:hypothetical protein [Lambiella insularis]